MTSSKPFLKWAGGKTQLIKDIFLQLPTEIKSWSSFTYIEPFAGSAAVMFSMIKKFSNLNRVVLNDINENLIKAYITVRDNPVELIDILTLIQNTYYLLDTEEKRKEYYYEKRELFNHKVHTDTENTALMIFLNRTCFNGLYRVNSKGEFNVPFGKYLKPLICDSSTILADSKILKNIEILCGDYEKTIDYTSENTLFYFDPPYRPLSRTSNFTAYSQNDFNDKEHERLKRFCDLVSERNYHFILSNSLPTDDNKEDEFLIQLFSGYTIKKVSARRAINSVPEKRGSIYEMLVTNYGQEEMLIFNQ